MHLLSHPKDLNRLKRITEMWLQHDMYRTLLKIFKVGDE